MAPSSATKRSLRCPVTTASHHSTTSLSQVSFPFWMAHFNKCQIKVWEVFLFFVVSALGSSELADLSMPCRMPADEDRAPQAQHICHSLPAMDLRYRAHLPRRQQRGEVKDIHSKGFILSRIFCLFGRIGLGEKVRVPPVVGLGQ